MYFLIEMYEKTGCCHTEIQICVGIKVKNQNDVK